MVKVKENLAGRKFGLLTVIQQSEDYINSSTGKHNARWLCKCECGNDVIVIDYNLKNGHTQSCGCFQKRRARETSIFRNRYDLSGDYGVGFCSNTGSEFYFDLEDFDLIKDYCWSEHITMTGYHRLIAYDPNTRKNIPMHYLVHHKFADHIDHNPLNNRKQNLRDATQSENMMNSSRRKDNTSKVIGVNWNKKDKRWRAYITASGCLHGLGEFLNFEDAVKARLIAEQELFGEFAPQKHLYKQYGIGDENNVHD